MTSTSAAREAVYQAFVDGWTAPGAVSENYQYTADNLNFKPPNEEPWARISVRHNGSTQQTLGPKGSRKFSRFGSAYVQLFTPTNLGTATADELSELVRGIFEGERLSGTTLWFQDVIIREAGVDGDWFQVVVEAEFEYDETK